MAGLEVQLGADIKDFQKKIQEVENDIQQLANEKAVNIKLGLDTKELDAHIKDAKKTLNDLKSTAKDAGLAFQKDLTPKVANGGNALMQFSRIAQDAPYGIQGVANNVTSAFEAFGHLQRQTGGAGAALKALAGSILGSGGVLLAVSLLTTALTYMSQNNLSVGDVIDKLTGNFDDLKKSMQNISNEAVKNSGAEIATMKALVSVSKDETASRNERLAAVQKLQSEYPAYFGNLTKEQILNGDVATAVKAVTNALIQKSKAQIIANRIAENDLKILQLQQEGQKLFADFTAGKGAFAVLKGAAAQQFLKTSADSTGKSIDALRKEQELLNSELEKSVKVANAFEAANKKASGKQKKTFETLQVSGLNSSLSAINNLVDLNTIEAFNGKIDEFKNKLRELPGTITTSFKGVRQNVSSESLKTLEVMSEFNKKVSEILNKGTSDAISGLGEAIGGALQKGGNVFSTVGDSLLSTLGGILIELGKMAISTGIGILAIQTALKSLNPYVAIGAGVALVALGSAVKGSVKGLGNTASSNASTGNYNTGASYGSPASSSSYASGGGSSASYGSGTVVFEIAGTKLLGVLNNTMNENKRLGGALG